MISVNEISKIAEKRNKLRKETYVKIYEQISKKVRQSAEFGNKFLLASIPSFVVGFPAFDRIKALHYIKRQLDLGGFTTRIVGEHELYIAWTTKKKSTPQPKEENLVMYAGFRLSTGLYLVFYCPISRLCMFV